jgi:hypothetical protein
MEYEDEFHRAADAAEVVAASINGDFSLLRLSEIFAGTESSLSELRTAEGGQLWGVTDPVHLTAEAYMEIGAAIVAQSGGDSSGRPGKRPRLESIVPAHYSGHGGRGIRGNVRAPLWVTGQAAIGAPTFRGGRGRARGGGRGNALPRGFRTSGRRPYRGRFQRRF